jgi:NADH-quinone oxidoreductase subunit G
MTENNTLTIDGRQIPIEGERNLLELIRKAGVDIPTFCYHSELSVYGACRLCIVDVEGRGVVTSCSTTPEPGLVVRTNTAEIRETRKLTIELLLADHDQNCATCGKSGACQLQRISQRLGVSDVRFKPTRQPVPIDESTPSLLRNPNRCVLCGDCVRVCAEVQGIGAIDFAGRGSDSTVAPAFGKNLADVECVHCGQCARVCPTGAIVPKPQIEQVWEKVYDEKKTVVAQIAPAVRVAIGESFGIPSGEATTGKIVAALKALGFDSVYDTSFAADLTVFEEATEFVQRCATGENLPQFTSCCPAWVKTAEQYYPELLPHLSSCKSPQQMFGALAKEMLPEQQGIAREDVVVVSIMPCTAKKAEAEIDAFQNDGSPDVDHVLTTQELARMIEEAGLDFKNIEPESLDMPFGFKTGAGVIFGTTGGVSEAVARYVTRELSPEKPAKFELHAPQEDDGVREATLTVGERTLRIGIVHGLAQAREIAQQAVKGECDYDLVEVMACPGGCVGGAGQPFTTDHRVRRQRAKGLYEADKVLQLHVPQENPFIEDLYENVLGEVGGEKAHHLLHRTYQSRKRVAGGEMSVLDGEKIDRLEVTVCVGTSCHLRGAQKILSGIMAHVRNRDLDAYVDVKATFCMERCDRGPSVNVGGRKLERTTLAEAVAVVDEEVEHVLACYEVQPQSGAYLTKNDFERQITDNLVRFLKNRHGAVAEEDKVAHECHGCTTHAGTDCKHH